MFTVRLSLVLLLVAPLSAAGPSATAHVRVGAAILHPLGFTAPASVASPEALGGADLHLSPSVEDGSTVLVSATSAEGESRLQGTCGRRADRLFLPDPPSPSRPASASTVTVMLVFN